MTLDAATEQKTLTKSLLGFFSGTLLSRLSGFFRDVSMAFFFGADASIAAFLVALRFAILLRRLFGEGALLNGFIPHFETYRANNPKEAAKFFRDTFFTLLIILIAIIGMIEIGLYFFSFRQPSEIVHLILFILPGTLFVCLFGISSALLHCEKQFFITGFAPVAYNAIWILAVLGSQSLPTPRAAVCLSCTITIAFFMQWLMTFPKTFRFLQTHISCKEMVRFRFFSPSVRQMLSSLSLGVIGVTATQINTALDAVLARSVSLEGPAYLNYAIHLEQLPLALFGIGIASVLLPSLSRAVQANDLPLCSQLVEFAISRSLWALLPCSGIIFVGGNAIVNLIYGRGHFGSTELLHTAECLWGYGWGLVPSALVLLLAPIFYARKDYKTPMICSLLSIGVNLGLNCVFVYGLHLGPASLAYSTSIAAAVNVCILVPYIDIGFSNLLRRSILTTSLCTLFAMGVSSWVQRTWFQELERHFIGQFVHFLALFISFGGTFFLIAVWFKKKEIVAFLRKKR